MFGFMLIASFGLFAQNTVIWSQSFESPGGYTTSGTEFTDGSADYYGRLSSADINADYNNPDGTYFLQFRILMVTG